jgi:hypothetical protein
VTEADEVVVVTEEVEEVDEVDSVVTVEDVEEDEVVDEEDSAVVTVVDSVVEVVVEEVDPVTEDEAVSPYGGYDHISTSHGAILTGRTPRWTRSTPRWCWSRWKARTRWTRTRCRHPRTPQARRCLHCQGQGALARHPKHDPRRVCLW